MPIGKLRSVPKKCNFYGDSHCVGNATYMMGRIEKATAHFSDPLSVLCVFTCPMLLSYVCVHVSHVHTQLYKYLELFLIEYLIKSKHLIGCSVQGLSTIIKDNFFGPMCTKWDGAEGLGFPVWQNKLVKFRENPRHQKYTLEKYTFTRYTFKKYAFRFFGHVLSFYHFLG